MIVIRDLPATAFPNRCRDIALDATLVGSPDTSPAVWLTTRHGNVKQLVWPAGWTARFGPDLEVRDASGVIRFHGGDHIAGGCVKGPPADPDSALMVWPLEGPL
jgi:hypothetical protein